MKDIRVQSFEVTDGNYMWLSTVTKGPGGGNYIFLLSTVTIVPSLEYGNYIILWILSM